jgi:hypothetical protein
MSEERATVTEEDIRSLQAKWQAFADSLTDREKAVFGHVVRTAAESDDVQGFDLDPGGSLANIDLQNVLQRQQQTLQMMSNISKMLHATMTATIRNLR